MRIARTAPLAWWLGLLAMPFRAAKEELLRRFETHYLQALLAETGGNESEAARRRGQQRRDPLPRAQASGPPRR